MPGHFNFYIKYFIRKEFLTLFYYIFKFEIFERIKTCEEKWAIFLGECL